MADRLRAFTDEELREELARRQRAPVVRCTCGEWRRAEDAKFVPARHATECAARRYFEETTCF